MSWSAKKMKAVKDANATAPKKKAPEDWSAGDRIGKLSLPALRDLRMRALTAGAVDVDRFVEIVELLESVLDVAREEQADSMVCAEELEDFARRLAAERDTAQQEQGNTERACDEQIEDLKQGHTQALADLAETADEYKRRAERAEHDLAETVRAGQALDQETNDRIRRVESERNALLAAAKEAIPEAEHPADPTIVHDWAWQVKKLGEDRRAIYKQKAEAEARAVAKGHDYETRMRAIEESAVGYLERAEKAEHALANERTATKLLEDALERQRKLTPMKTRRK